MTNLELEQIKTARENLHSLISNRLIYPKVLISMTRSRALTEAEIQKVNECFDECVRILDAELTLLLFKLEKP